MRIPRHCLAPPFPFKTSEQLSCGCSGSLLPVVHRHWAPIFSIVHTASIDTGRQRRLYPLLFECAAQSLLEFGRNRLHGDLGITAVLHTWGQKLDFHPHLHFIVTGGALMAKRGSTFKLASMVSPATR